jgi:predicted nucleotidyltransferase
MKMCSAVFPSLCADRPTNRHEDDVHIFRLNHSECNTQQCLGINHELSWSWGSFIHLSCRLVYHVHLNILKLGWCTDYSDGVMIWMPKKSSFSICGNKRPYWLLNGLQQFQM